MAHEARQALKEQAAAVPRRWPWWLPMCLLLAACGATAPDLEPEEVRPAAVTRSSTGKALNVADARAQQGNRNLTLRVVRELPMPPQTRGGGRVALSPGDVLQITFFKVDKLDREVQIDGTGNISMPLVGTVRAAGRSPRELERELKRLYGARYLQNPQIAVNVKKSVGQRVTINGEVRLPGVYPVAPGTTLLQALALGRGFTPIADTSKVFVYRKVGGVQYVARYDVNAIQSGRRADPRIFGGDIIAVFPSSSKVALENLKAVLGVASQAGSLAVLPAP